jgi:hypothetical protein
VPNQEFNVKFLLLVFTGTFGRWFPANSLRICVYQFSKVPQIGTRKPICSSLGISANYVSVWDIGGDVHHLLGDDGGFLELAEFSIDELDVELVLFG